ncbi:hypothetical protein BDZ89DRAFT_585122 [Hymenopellis radicata]|nr:hypothetical protein BDZ89DRAFT_585122 [Hymenopellis radicata]
MDEPCLELTSQLNFLKSVCRRHMRPRQPHVPVGLNSDRTPHGTSPLTTTPLLLCARYPIRRCLVHVDCWCCLRHIFDHSQTEGGAHVVVEVRRLVVCSLSFLKNFPS